MLPGAWNRGGVTPFEGLWDIRREMDRLLDSFTPAQQSQNGLAWVPAMDIVETDNEILCHLEVPGLTRDDLEIRVEGNVVTIAGEKRYQTNGEKEGGFRHLERRFGRFERSFSIPRTVDADAVKARHDNGVLTVVLPKAERSKPRRVQIEADQKSKQITK